MIHLDFAVMVIVDQAKRFLLINFVISVANVVK
jgi:hypothetical protein